MKSFLRKSLLGLSLCSLIACAGGSKSSSPATPPSSSSSQAPAPSAPSVQDESHHDGFAMMTREWLEQFQQAAINVYLDQVSELQPATLQQRQLLGVMAVASSIPRGTLMSQDNAWTARQLQKIYHAFFTDDGEPASSVDFENLHQQLNKD